MHFSRDYGFGLIDAHAAVRMAETWGVNSRTSANETLAFEDFINGSETIDGVVNGGNTAINSGSETYTWTETTNVRIEQVTFDVAFETTFLADMEFTVTSPDGTTHTVINDVGGGTVWGDNDGFFDGNERWTYTSNAFWGEQSVGLWSITITDDAGGDETLFTDFDIYMHGSSNVTDDRLVFTDAFADYSALFGHDGDLFDAGAGNDTLNAAAVTSDTTIDLSTGGGTIAGINVTGLASIENVFTGDGDDTVTSGAAAEVISTGRGGDTLIKTGALDPNNPDRYDGGAGNDTFVYDFNFASNTVFDLDLGAILTGLVTPRDSLVNIENLTVGGAASLRGDNGSNRLEALGTGANVINGRGGIDTLLGGVATTPCSAVAGLTFWTAAWGVIWRAMMTRAMALWPISNSRATTPELRQGIHMSPSKASKAPYSMTP